MLDKIFMILAVFTMLMLALTIVYDLLRKIKTDLKLHKVQKTIKKLNEDLIKGIKEEK